MPQISVIVPVYKVEPYIHRCVDSILNQSYSDFELILVDDGSPDACGAICDDYAEKDSRVHVIHQKNGGLSAARNAGIDWAMANSNSQWLTFVDSDDWIHIDYLNLLLEAAERFQAPISMCDYIRTDRVCADCAAEGAKYCCLESEKAYASAYGMCMTACCKIYRKYLFEDIRFPLGKLHEDAYVTHLLVFGAGKIAVCDVSLYFYFANPGSITRVKWSEKRLEELESHEIRAAWLLEHGYHEAHRREIEVYVMTVYEQAEALAKLSLRDSLYRKYLKTVRKKLLCEMKKAKSMGLCLFEREYLWMHLMAYPLLPVWYAGQWLRNIRNNIRISE